MALALNYINSFPPTLPIVLVHKILNMRPRHPVAELMATETLELMLKELTNFYIDGGGYVWDPHTGVNLDVSVNQMLDSCMFPMHRRMIKGPRQAEWSFAECFFFCYLWRKGRLRHDWAVWSDDSEGEYCVSCDNSDCTCRVWFENEFYDNRSAVYGDSYSSTRR